MQKKRKWMILAAMVIFIIAVGAVFCRFYFGGTSARRLKDRYGRDVPQFCSSVDRDKDGIDDQTDILEGTLKYIKTKPEYKSVYYETGYPNDGYGVCTDVVAFSMLNAGYDLRELVQEDIQLHPEDYEIEKPDVNIDFRRVRNLLVYFSHTAVELTTDLSDIEEWQGGDIVIFEGHIGIVSDRRNKNGVPYLIHHSNPHQLAYEEDLLERRDDLVAHYRVTQ